MIKYFTLLVFLTFSLYAKHPQLDVVSKEDKKKLEAFFKYLMHNSIIGYSLSGQKPIAIETFPVLAELPSQYAAAIFIKNPGYSILWHGWKTWEKYASLFPSSKFVLRFIHKYHTLALINKLATRQVIEENIDLFHKYSKLDQSSEEILNEVCYPKQKEYLVLNNTILLGILLGYGRNNSIAFGKKSYVQKIERFKLYEGDIHLSSIMNPGLMIIKNGTNEEENNQILKCLREAKQNLQEAFKNGNYFEVFIELYTQ